MKNKSEVKKFRISNPESDVLLDVSSGFGQPADIIVTVDGERVFQGMANVKGENLGKASSLKDKEVNVHVMAQDKNTNTDNFDISIRVYEESGSEEEEMDYTGKASKKGEIVILDFLLFMI